MTTWRVVSVLMLAACALALPASGFGDDGGGSDPQALAALADVPGVLAASAGATTSDDGVSAMVAQDTGGAVSAPTDPASGVTVDPADGSPVTVGVPAAGDAVAIAPGVVDYPNVDQSSAVAVQVLPDDGVRLMAMLYDANAPTDYAFDLTVPDGGSVVSDGNGGYVIDDADSEPTVQIAAPWARDANDAAVPASYTLDGSTLTLHVDTTGAAFPIVADPQITPAKKKPKPEQEELVCRGVGTSIFHNDGCSISVLLKAGPGGSDTEQASMLVRCKGCNNDQELQFERFYASMVNWNVETGCFVNCVEGGPEVYYTEKLLHSERTVRIGNQCLVGFMWVDCATVQTSETYKLEKHYTCGSSVVGATVVPLPGRMYLVIAQFRLTCPDGGGVGTGTIEANDFRDAGLGLSA